MKKNWLQRICTNIKCAKCFFYHLLYISFCWEQCEKESTSWKNSNFVIAIQTYTLKAVKENGTVERQTMNSVVNKKDQNISVDCCLMDFIS